MNLPDRVSLDASPQDARYFSALARGVFEIPRCEDCGRWHFYPRVCCPYCHSEALVWESPSGQGTVYSTTVVRKSGGADYCVCLVDLQEGPRMMSTVIDVPPDAVHIGQQVQARVDLRGEAALLVFAPVGGAA